jgi:hypothetical protein
LNDPRVHHNLTSIGPVFHWCNSTPHIPADSAHGVRVWGLPGFPQASARVSASQTPRFTHRPPPTSPAGDRADLYSFDPEANRWADLTNPSAGPPARYGLGMSASADRLFLFGGLASSAGKAPNPLTPSRLPAPLIPASPLCLPCRRTPPPSPFSLQHLPPFPPPRLPCPHPSPVSFKFPCAKLPQTVILPCGGGPSLTPSSLVFSSPSVRRLLESCVGGYFRSGLKPF